MTSNTAPTFFIKISQAIIHQSSSSTLPAAVGTFKGFMTELILPATAPQLAFTVATLVTKYFVYTKVTKDSCITDANFDNRIKGSKLKDALDNFIWSDNDAENVVRILQLIKEAQEMYENPKIFSEADRRKMENNQNVIKAMDEAAAAHRAAADLWKKAAENEENAALCSEDTTKASYHIRSADSYRQSAISKVAEADRLDKIAEIYEKGSNPC